MDIWQIGTWKLILAGGPFMIPIILCSVVALAIIVERFLYFSSIEKAAIELKEPFLEKIRASNIKDAILFCETNPSPLSKILKAGALRFGANREEIKEAMEEASLSEIPKLEHRLAALATIAHTAPLLGFLGTVGGIASSFYSIQMRATSLNPITPADLAGGIWEALITTMAGLIVAIPAFVAYNYFFSRANTLTSEMEHAANELVNLLIQINESYTARRARDLE